MISMVTSGLTMFFIQSRASIQVQSQFQQAAQMVLEVWWMHSIGHPEVEEDRPVYECRVCQDPATKRLLAKMGGARWAMKSPK